MKFILITTACILLGSGVGLLILESIIGTPLQVFVISALALGTLLLRFPRSEWAPPLALSLASSLTVINLRMSFSLLYLVLTDREVLSRASPLLGNLEVPSSLFSESMLSLLLITHAMLVGFFLVHDSVIRALSSLWEGVEALPTTLEHAAGHHPQNEFSAPILAGIMVGFLSAMLDVFFPLDQMGFRLYHAGFTILMLASSTLATVITLGVHLFFTIVAFQTVNGVSAKAVYSIYLGIQAGVLVSTLVAAILLHTWGAARSFSRIIVSIAASAIGVLIMILGFTFIISPTYVIFITLFIILIIFLSDLITIRLEGGFYLPTSVPDSFAPSIMSMAILFLSSLVGVQDLVPIVIVFLNPSIHLLLAMMSMWNHKLSKSYMKSIILAITCILAPTGLMLARAAMRYEYEDPLIYIQKEWMTGLVYKQPLGLNLIASNFDISIFIVTTCLVSVFNFLLNYYRQANSKLSWAALAFDSTGLLVAYSSMWSNGSYFCLDSSSAFVGVFFGLILLIALLHYIGIIKFTLHYRQVINNALSFYGTFLLILKLVRY